MKLAEYGLKLDLKKCSFFRDEVIYLGHRVSAEGIAMDPSKITDVTNWSTPSTLKELRSFLGFASYYRRYVSRVTQIASPLHQLVTSTCQEMKGKAGKNTGMGFSHPLLVLYVMFDYPFDYPLCM